MCQSDLTCTPCSEWSLQDIRVGSTLQIYGRSIFVTDCDPFTRRKNLRDCTTSKNIQNLGLPTLPDVYCGPSRRSFFLNLFFKLFNYFGSDHPTIQFSTSKDRFYPEIYCHFRETCFLMPFSPWVYLGPVGCGFPMVRNTWSNFGSNTPWNPWNMAW